MRKAQIEILGLMIIVILLIFGLILYFKFAAKSSSSDDLLQTAEKNLEVSNLLSAVRLSTVCDKTSFDDVVKACNDGTFACEKEGCTLLRTELSSRMDAYGINSSRYMFFVGEEMFSFKCEGEHIVESYNMKGKTVKLVFCY